MDNRDNMDNIGNRDNMDNIGNRDNMDNIGNRDNHHLAFVHVSIPGQQC